MDNFHYPTFGIPFYMAGGFLSGFTLGVFGAITWISLVAIYEYKRHQYLKRQWARVTSIFQQRFFN